MNSTRPFYRQRLVRSTAQQHGIVYLKEKFYTAHFSRAVTAFSCTATHHVEYDVQESIYRKEEMTVCYRDLKTGFLLGCAYSN